jgi:hypothetical protein
MCLSSCNAKRDFPGSPEKANAAPKRAAVYVYWEHCSVWLKSVVILKKMFVQHMICTWRRVACIIACRMHNTNTDMRFLVLQGRGESTEAERQYSECSETVGEYYETERLHWYRTEEGMSVLQQHVPADCRTVGSAMLTYTGGRWCWNQCLRLVTREWAQKCLSLCRDDR